jgi:hypothetical protein
MAAGTLEQVTVIADPQAGTSNQPFPVGNLPPYVPVTTTIVDTSAASITAQTTALTLQLKLLHGALVQVNNNLAKMADESKVKTKSINDFNIGILGWASTKSNQSVTIAAAAAATAKSNNFYRAASDAAPVMPSVDNQLKESITDAINLNVAATAQGAITSIITRQLIGIQNWITGTEVYKTVSGFIKAKLTTITSSISASVNRITSNVKAALGSKSL